MILSLDQSLTCTGYVLLSSNRTPLKFGTIRTDPFRGKQRNVHVGADDARRCALLCAELKHVLRTNEVRLVAAELPGGSLSARAAKALGLAQGTVVATCRALDYPLVWVTALDAKDALAETRKAEKDQMVQAATPHLPSEFLKRNKADREAIADALGVGFAAFSTETAMMLLHGYPK